MAHPHHEHRQHKVEHRRVAHITKGYAHGGAVHGDEAEDRRLIHQEVKKSALKVDGKHAKHRADKPHRARGGRTNRKGGKTVVNVIAGGAHPPMAVPAPMAPPIGPAAAPPMPVPPPRPPMPGPMAGAPPVPGMPPRRSGGRAYKAGGRVADGPAWKEGLRAGTQVTHVPAKDVVLKNLGRGKPVTYKTGGRIEASNAVEPATKLPGGAGGGEGRLAKEKRAARDYKKA